MAGPSSAITGPAIRDGHKEASTTFHAVTSFAGYMVTREPMYGFLPPLVTILALRLFNECPDETKIGIDWEHSALQIQLPGKTQTALRTHNHDEHQDLHNLIDSVRAAVAGLLLHEAIPQPSGAEEEAGGAPDEPGPAPAMPVTLESFQGALEGLRKLVGTYKEDPLFGDALAYAMRTIDLGETILTQRRQIALLKEKIEAAIALAQEEPAATATAEEQPPTLHRLLEDSLADLETFQLATIVDFFPGGRSDEEAAIKGLYQNETLRQEILQIWQQDDWNNYHHIVTGITAAHGADAGQLPTIVTEVQGALTRQHQAIMEVAARHMSAP